MKWDEWNALDRLITIFVACCVAIALLHVAFGLGTIAALLRDPDASGWVQAIGSLVALMIAIWVPNRIHRSEANERREREMARAYIAAIEVVQRSVPFIPHARSLLSQCEYFQLALSQGRRIDLDLEHLRETLPALPLPTETQMHDLVAASSSAARDIARGLGFMGQIKTLLVSVKGPMKWETHVANVEMHALFASNAIAALDRGLDALNDYLRSQDERIRH